MSRESILRHHRAVAFFAEHAGFSYMPGVETPEEGKLRTARELADSEEFASDAGLAVEWEDDWSVDHVKEYDCYEDGGPSTCELATLVSEDGDILGVLGCIDDATPEYRRVIAAELADEYRFELRREAERTGRILAAAFSRPRGAPMTEPTLPPRKDVTAWEIEPMEENGDDFCVLTFHHGLGRMTRMDLWNQDVEDLIKVLRSRDA